VERLVEICDTWYYHKIIVPLIDVDEVKCLCRLRKYEKIIYKVYKGRPQKYLQIIKNLIENFGTPVSVHEWKTYSRGSRMLPPGIRIRTHVLYKISEWLWKAIGDIVKISDLRFTRKLPHDLHTKEPEEITETIKNVLDEAIANQIAKEIAPT